MRRGVFVTGTDTGIGKTVAACALVAALRARGLAVMPMKPIAAGSVQRDDTWINEDTEALLAAAGLDASAAARVTPILLREAMAPHLAARHEGRALDITEAVRAYEELGGDFAVVEGVGGFKVPLDERTDTVDLARAFGLPVVLVVGMRLGCLNHALLTRDAIAAAGLGLAGWIANTIDPAMAALDENVEALRARIDAPLLGRLPHAPGAAALILAGHLDTAALA